MRNTYNATPEPGYIVRQSLLKFYLRQLTEVGQTARERTKSIGVKTKF